MRHYFIKDLANQKVFPRERSLILIQESSKSTLYYSEEEEVSGSPKRVSTTQLSEFAL